jgi:methylmalonyl-CoA mutase N-terminal domain/subunit
MYDRQKLEEIRQALEKWEETKLQQTQARFPERQDQFITTSSDPIERLYTPLDIQDLDYEQDLGFPGEYPFTRGVHPTLHRSKLWTMRMFAGFGTAEETNARFKYLLDQGQTGLSVAFDLPTLMGYGNLAGGYPAGQGLHQHDDQFPGGDHLGHVPGGC